MDVARDVTEVWKIYLAGGGLALALVWNRMRRSHALALLTVLVVVAAVNHARWGFDSFSRRVDVYDMFHHYVNAKYFDELGYFDLYPAVILVDHQNDGPFFEEGHQYLAQDADGHRMRSIGHALDRGRVVRQRFTDRDWSRFTHDVLYLQRTLGCRERDARGDCYRELHDRLWRQMIQDHGFNAPPAWTLLARGLTWVPVESIKWLGYVDVLLLLAALGAVCWAFGPAPTLWTLLFLLVSYSMRWPPLTWVLLRYDWLAGLLLAAAFLKKGRYALAGVFAGWSAVLRFFPAMWMFGPGARFVAGWVRGEKSRQFLALAAAFAATVIVFQAAATLRFGAEQVTDHFENMLDHNSAEQLSSRRVGLALAMAYTPQGPHGAPRFITRAQKQEIDRQRPFRYAVAAIVMLALAFGLRRSPHFEAWGYGFLPFFLLTTASYYYYIARATLALTHAADLSRQRNRVGLAYLLGLEVFCNWAETSFPGRRVFLIWHLALGLALYTVGAVLWLNRDAEDQAETEGSSARTASAHDPDEAAPNSRPG